MDWLVGTIGRRGGTSHCNERWEFRMVLPVERADLPASDVLPKAFKV
jgi:hypothetical protein